MSTFDYLQVLFSVIVGLAVTEILQGLRRLIYARARVKIFLPPLFWSVLMIVVVAQTWWGMFAMRGFPSWTFAMYAAVLLQITLMYLATGMVLPEVPEEGAVDMRAAYFKHKNWFFGLMAATIASTFLKDAVLNGHVSSSWNAWYLVFFFLLAVIAAVVKWRWYHWALAPFSATLVAVYTVYLSFRL